MSKLVIDGGKRIRVREFSKYNTIGLAEKNAVSEVMDTGILSAYFGKAGDGFLGGERVQGFEKNWAEYFNVKHAVSVNSWTSGLVTMISAMDFEIGEIITTPWTMCATAAAIVHAGHSPVFADIDPIDFCIDPSDVERKITKKTRAILAVDIHGGSAKMDELLVIAKAYDIKVISDAAQSPGGKYKDNYTGTLADIGGFSLNYHKHIHTGEGGMIVTNDDALAFKCQLIRNHAEAYMPSPFENSLVGHNFRMGEIEAAIGNEQLKKLNTVLAERKQIAGEIIELISGYHFLTIPEPENVEHVFYVIPLVFSNFDASVSRDWLISALHAEGLKNVYGGFANIHKLPYFKKNFPTTDRLPIAENMHENNFVCFQNCMYALDDPTERSDFLKILEKVLDNASKYI